MKLISKTSQWHSAVCGEDELVFEVNKEEADELRAALKLIERYEKMCRVALRITKADKPDFIMYGYAVKNDKVVVTATSGACG